MAIEIDGYSINIDAADLLALVRNLEGLPKFFGGPEEITLTVLDSGDLNILITKRKDNASS